MPCSLRSRLWGEGDFSQQKMNLTTAGPQVRNCPTLLLESFYHFHGRSTTELRSALVAGEPNFCLRYLSCSVADCEIEGAKNNTASPPNDSVLSVWSHSRSNI